MQTVDRENKQVVEFEADGETDWWYSTLALGKVLAEDYQVLEMHELVVCMWDRVGNRLVVDAEQSTGMRCCLVLVVLVYTVLVFQRTDSSPLDSVLQPSYHFCTGRLVCCHRMFVWNPS